MGHSLMTGKKMPGWIGNTVSTALLGEAFEPEALFEHPDGTPILFNRDYFGIHRSVNPTSGPFESEEAACRQPIWTKEN